MQLLVLNFKFLIENSQTTKNSQLIIALFCRPLRSTGTDKGGRDTFAA
jgi:hypothetical protein